MSTCLTIIFIPHTQALAEAHAVCAECMQTNEMLLMAASRRSLIKEQSVLASPAPRHISGGVLLSRPKTPVEQNGGEVLYDGGSSPKTALFAEIEPSV